MRTPTNSRSGCPRENSGGGIALPDFRKEIEFESSFDGGSLLIGEDRVHEQIRRDVGHVYAPWCRDAWASYQPALAAPPRQCPLWVISGHCDNVISMSPLPPIAEVEFKAGI